MGSSVEDGSVGIMTGSYERACGSGSRWSLSDAGRVCGFGGSSQVTFVDWYFTL